MKIAGFQSMDRIADLQGSVEDLLRGGWAADSAGAKLAGFAEGMLQGYVVTPEHVSKQAIDLEGEPFHRILELLRAVPCVLVFGVFERDADGFWNTAVVVHRGILLGKVRKHRLLRSEQAVFRAGTEFPVFEVDGLRFGINICMDLRFPECAQAVAAQGAQLLVCPCNNMLPRYPEATQWKDRHNSIRAKRCQESSLWLLSADVCGTRDDRVSWGPSAVISPAGEVVVQAPLEREGLVLWDLPE